MHLLHFIGPGPLHSFMQYLDTDGGAPGVTVTDVELPPGSADLDIEYGRPQVINVRASRESNASSEDMGKKRTSV